MEHPDNYYCPFHAREEQIEELSDEVFRQLFAMGIKNWGDRTRLAKMMCEAYYAEFDEAIEFAESMGLEKQNIWCYMKTDESLTKFDNWRNNQY